ncbi:hypothetical protein [Bacillus luti]|uniref:Uncharacterized protein n=1 Tax=Bacillus luti TaxID=2026191 RepID=A0A7V7VCM9_9BACI|nr:hypothetical protein [Bacillus luti]KAB2444971.1 hypothetical protein F8163_07240 [Bacillus luti]
MERTILDNPPSEETALKMAEFFMKTSVPRILAARKAEQEKRRVNKNERSICSNKNYERA